jgi:hypothetical protein
MIELYVNDNTKILVQTGSNSQWVERGIGDTCQAKLEFLLDTLKSIGEEMSKKFSEAQKSISSIELQIGFEIGAEGNFIISKVATKAQINGIIKWDFKKA